MTSYKSPGVYVEEVPKLPQSVADVPTAIPGFVGYTQFASSNSDRTVSDLLKKPTKITSLLDYERYFGVGNANDRHFVLYDSIRLFYDNGGGVCYIVSVGNYTDDPNGDELKKGLDPLREIDEVTLLVVPDAATCLSLEELAKVQSAALIQCGELKDRFAILDVQEKTDKSLDKCLEDFRNSLSTNFPEYGAAYYPYLSTSYTYANADFSEVVNKIVSAKFTDDGKLNVDLLLNATLEENKISGVIEFLKGETSSCLTFLRALTDKTPLETYVKTKSNDELKGFYTPIRISYKKLDEILDNPSSFGLGKKLDLQKDVNDKYELEQDTQAFKAYVESNKKPSDKAYKELTQEERILIGCKYLQKLVVEEKITKVINEESSTYLPNYVCALDPIIDEDSKKIAEDSAKSFIPFYEVYEKEMALDMSIVPPSGAIAGIYAQNDNFSGVWKAPANMAIASIKGVSRLINNQMQEDMNVTSSGKSINAIRAFSGKGILVWGARTLKGNDNEWRYVPVRRLFNYVEESVQESTEWAVFAPNTQNTWTKIKCQIENFLTNIWRAGGLAGSTPAEAFYVNVGLGTTMDSVDILEGRLIVEIGMAAVRPAEFIVLRFSHKLQES